MSRQAKKYSISMAGEFFVAAQLQRMNVSASVTYGNAKCADVIVRSNNDEGRSLVIEVKATDKSKWKVGDQLPQPSNKIWIFVHMPTVRDEPPSFYVLTQKEIHDLCRPEHDAYNTRYKAKHGKNYEGKGFISIKHEQVKSHKNEWQKIINRVGAADA